MALRTVKKLVSGTRTSDGAGVKLLRIISTRSLPSDEVDPFLMLDYFSSDDPSDYVAGFPDHPHRGFETVTYMLSGKFAHKDKCGNSGLLESGSIQWMTAGKGIIHSETPMQEKGLIAGFQLWVNLPKKDKMCEPRYQDVQSDRIPIVQLDDEGSLVKVLVGQYGDTIGPVEGGYVKPQYLDVKLKPGQTFEHKIDTEHTTWAYVYAGSGTVADSTPVPGHKLVLFNNDAETIRFKAGDKIDPMDFGDGKLYALQFILVSAIPLHEPVVQHGPFVMNTQEEIRQAFQDYQEGKLGRY